MASVGCAAAVNLPMLVATRVLQGVGGAMMVPVGRLVVLRTTAKTDLVRAIAYLTWPALLAPVLAPALGGVLSTYASWRWIFVINVPLGRGRAAAGPAAGAGRARRRAAARWTGAASRSPRSASRRWWSAWRTSAAPTPDWTVAAIALVLAAASLGRGRAATCCGPARPLLDLRILRVPTYRITALSGSVFRAVISAIPFLLPLFFQLGFGWTAAEAGLVVIALFAGNVGDQAADHAADAPLRHPHGDARLGRRLGRLPGRRSPSCSATTPLPVAARAAGCSAGSSGRSGSPPTTASRSPTSQPDRMTGANTLMSTVQELGAGLGRRRRRAAGPAGRAGGRRRSASGPAPTRPFRVAFVLLAVILLGPLVEGLRLSRAAGNEVTGRA